MIDNKVEEIKEHLEKVMEILEIPVTKSNKNTPLRISKMWCNELFDNRNDRHLDELNDKMKVFPNNYDSDMVIMRDIDFNSTAAFRFQQLRSQRTGRSAQWYHFSGYLR